MFRKVIDQMESANFKARAAKGELACPSCGAKPSHVPAQSGEVIACGTCGIKASAGEWAAKVPADVFPGRADQPLVDTKITRRTDVPGTTVWQIPASGKFGFFLFFGVIWCAITAIVSGGFLLAFLSGKAVEGDFPEWVLIPFFGIFWAVGLGVLYAAFRNKYASHRITADARSVTLVRELFGKFKKKSLPADSIESIAQAVFYQQNYEPVYGVEIRGKRGKLRFGSSLTAEEKAWLVADLRRVVLGDDAAQAIPAARQAYFSVTLPQSRKHLWPFAVMMTLMGVGFFFVGIYLIDGGEARPSGSSPGFLHGIDVLFWGLSNSFRTLWIFMSGIMATGGLALMIWMIRTRDRETRVEGTESEISIRSYQRGLILQDRSFPRDSVSDIRASVSGSSNGQPMKRIELIAGNRAEKIASWVDGEKADVMVAEVRGALGIAS